MPTEKEERSISDRCGLDTVVSNASKGKSKREGESRPSSRCLEAPGSGSSKGTCKVAAASTGGTGLLDERSGVPPARGEVGGAVTWSDDRDHGGRLLHREGAAEWHGEKGGARRRRCALGSGGPGNSGGVTSQGAQCRSSSTFHGPPMPLGVPFDGDGRALPPRPSCQVGHGSPQGGALDEKLGEGRRKRRSTRRRSCGVEKEVRGIGSCGTGSRGEEGQEEEFEFVGRSEKKEGEEAKEEEEEGGRRSRGTLGWKETRPGECKRSQSLVWRHGVGPEGEGSAPCGKEGTVLYGQEQEIEGVFKQQQFFLFNNFGDGRSGTRRPFLGDFEGENGGRPIPRCTWSRKSSMDEGGFAGETWRGDGGPRSEAYGDDVLPAAVAWQGQPTSGSRVGDSCDLSGHAAEGKGGECSGRDPPAFQVDRSLFRRHPLVGGPTHGNPPGGHQPSSPKRRDQECPEGQLRGVANYVAGEPPKQWEGRKRKKQRRERRQGEERPRRERRCEEGSEGQRPREEVSCGSADAIPYDGSGDGAITVKAVVEAPVEKSGVDTAAGLSAGYSADNTLMSPDLMFEPQCQGFRPSAEEAGVVSSTLASANDSGIPPQSGKKDLECAVSDLRDDFLDLDFCGLGKIVLQKFLEVFPLRGKPMGLGSTDLVFPLPTSRPLLHAAFPDLSEGLLCWLICTTVGLNSLWGGSCFSESSMSDVQRKCLDLLVNDVKRLGSLEGKIESFNWRDFFLTRTVDYQGDEVKIAMFFKWENIRPALPDEIGRVPLSEVCRLGAKFYVDNFDLFVKDKSEWTLSKPPRVMVREEDWGEVCSGLVERGVCTYLTRDEVFDTGQGPLLNGLFGVTKDEKADGVEVYRLIMNLIPLNGICSGLSGDVATLPSWSSMSPYFIQPTESLLVSSEDVRCFFYTMSVPEEWWKYLAFNKPVPQGVIPDHLQGEQVYLAARVLPMGFLNSVSLAQHVHRNLVLWSGEEKEANNKPEEELRKDKHFSDGQQNWRVYLDNYDLLEKVQSTEVAGLSNTLAPPVLALREQYEVWEVPRNVKKSTVRSARAEVQGAIIDGIAGVAFPREGKLLKYLSAGLKLCGQTHVTQRQLQVVCGGLVYLCMFRRPLLGCLNAVWRQIESFNQIQASYLPLWPECRFEVIRFLGLTALVRMNFRTEIHPQVTCSDASSSGGGICASSGLTEFGDMASTGSLRGHNPEDRSEHRVLVVSLFDGIGALRVALDLLQVDVVGYISVEKDIRAKRVVESVFPQAIFIDEVEQVDDKMVAHWVTLFSQCSLVLLGAGPPCQGVSGLNPDRKGALKDARSCLFTHVGRVKKLLVRHFVWCPLHALMESVASMDDADRDEMSKDFGDEPWKCDAGTVSWCSRPRLFWITWSLYEAEGVHIVVGDSTKTREVVLTAEQDLEEVCEAGWIKVDPSRPFPTFTTARPRDSPGRKPAGILSCSDDEVLRWQQDRHRFPPYQYTNKNCLINRKGDLRVPSVSEREFMLGFPVGYTTGCLPKGQRKGELHLDTRNHLLGNSWSVPVAACLVSQLLTPLGLCREVTVQDIVNKLRPKENDVLQQVLLRRPLRPVQHANSQGSQVLAQRLASLVSVKGEDILLTSSANEQARYHRLRATVPSRLWKWKVVSGWKWTRKGDHINVLELRAILTALRWRIGHKHHVGVRLVHLTDSLVCLHALTRGRSSSRKLRRTLCRINALLLAGSSQALWAYVHTDQNPADRPSRWGRSIKTKFKNA